MSLIPGTWNLPMDDHYAITMTFSRSKQFTCMICAATPRERLRQAFFGDEIRGNWHIRSRKPPQGTVGGSVNAIERIGRGSVVRLTDLVAPPSELGPKPGYEDGEEGPFLVLNYTDFPQSLLNIHAFGFNVKLGNWLSAIRQVISDDYHKILEIDKERLVIDGRNGPEHWGRGEQS